MLRSPKSESTVRTFAWQLYITRTVMHQLPHAAQPDQRAESADNYKGQSSLRFVSTARYFQSCNVQNLKIWGVSARNPPRS